MSVPPKLKIVLSLLAIALIMQAIALLAFRSMDNIVHRDLYLYSMVFDIAWARPYWNNSGLLSTSLTIAIISIALSAALILPSTKGAITHKPEIEGIRKRTARNQTNKLASLTLLATGTAALLVSFFYATPTPAFIGLGLIFWGILFLYIRTEEYAKKTLLDTIANPQATTLNQIITELRFKGKPIYLPPKYFTNPETLKAFIPRQIEDLLPTPEQIQKQGSLVFTSNPLGMLLTPSGSELSKLFEKTLTTNFARADLQYLGQNLPRLLIEELDIARNFEIESKDSKILIRIEYSKSTAPKDKKDDYNSPLNSILASAFACTLAKTTGNPITIDKLQTSPDGKSVTIEYDIITKEAQTKP